MSDLTHLDAAGAARMVDVGGKDVTAREAVAEGFIAISSNALEAIRANAIAKGDVLAVARVAGIMAAKRTSDLIPLCHALPLTHASIDFTIRDNGIQAIATVATQDRTGVEMEALTAVSTALLTIYDMTKAIDRGLEIGAIRLVRKTGGRSGTWVR